MIPRCRLGMVLESHWAFDVCVQRAAHDLWSCGGRGSSSDYQLPKFLALWLELEGCCLDNIPRGLGLLSGRRADNRDRRTVAPLLGSPL